MRQQQRAHIHQHLTITSARGVNEYTSADTPAAAVSRDDVAVEDARRRRRAAAVDRLVVVVHQAAESEVHQLQLRVRRRADEHVVRLLVVQLLHAYGEKQHTTYM